MQQRRMSIATRVILSILTVASLLLGAYFVIEYRSDRERELAGLHAELAANADRLSIGLTLPVWNFDHEQIDKVIESIMKDDAVYGVVLKLSDVRSTVISRARDAAWHVKNQQGEFPTEGLLMEEREIRAGDDPLGTVRVFVTPKFVEAQLHETLFMRAGSTLVLGVLLTVSLYLLLQRTVLEPLKEVERFASAVTSGDASEHLQPALFSGELEKVRSSIQQMVDQLDARITALRQSEEKFRRLIKLLPLPVVIDDQNGDIEYLNDKFVATFGYTRADIPNRNDWWPLAYPDENYRREVMAKWAHAVEHSAQEHSIKSHEYRVTCKDGSVRTVEISGVNLGLNNLVIFIDITERLRAEESLRNNERRLTLAISATADAIWEWNTVTQKTYYSPRWYEMLGYKNNEFEMNFDSWRARCHPDDLQRALDAIQITLAEKSTIPYEAEFRMKAADGSWLWILGRGSVVDRDASGKPLLMSGTNTNITERKQAEEERTLLHDQLQQAAKMEAVGRLAGGIAHDFNNLLTVIGGNVELIRAQIDDHDPIARNIDGVSNAADRAAQLTRQLLTYSRRQIIEPKILSVNQLIRNVREMLLRLIDENVEVKIALNPNLGMVKIDQNQFEQVLVNLAINARDAMPNGGTLIIETSNVDLDQEYCARHTSMNPGEYVMLAVTDTGHGMNEDIKQHIFEPFFTTKGPGQGTGLGLAMVFGVVKQAGGSVEVYSEVGIGTTFKLYLPRREESASVAVSEEPRSVPQIGNECILFVEDDVSVREMGQGILKHLGYSVLVAKSPKESLTLVKEHSGPIHLLITDIVMPEINGRDLAELILGMRPSIKVLFTSGYTENVIVHHGVLKEHLNFIGKPYTIKSLSLKIRAVLSGVHS